MEVSVLQLHKVVLTNVLVQVVIQDQIVPHVIIRKLIKNIEKFHEHDKFKDYVI